MTDINKIIDTLITKQGDLKDEKNEIQKKIINMPDNLSNLNMSDTQDKINMFQEKINKIKSKISSRQSKIIEDENKYITSINEEIKVLRSKLKKYP